MQQERTTLLMVIPGPYGICFCLTIQMLEPPDRVKWA